MTMKTGRDLESVRNIIWTVGFLTTQLNRTNEIFTFCYTSVLLTNTLF